MAHPEDSTAVTRPAPSPAARAWLAFCWLWVGVPLAWGVFETVQRSLALFR